MRDELIALLKAGNRQHPQLKLEGAGAEIVFGQSKYAQDDNVVFYGGDRSGEEMTPEDAADAFLAELSRP